MSGFVIGLEAVDRSAIGLVGGKAAQLGELLRIDGVRVPPGFCVTTAAFRKAVAGAISSDTAATRAAIEAAPVPDDVAADVRAALRDLGGSGRFAVRSSATAEDLPAASFAGQHDSFLDVGADDVLRHVARCWASVFTDRAVAYRARRGIDHRRVEMAVVVQRMVDATAAGVLFTADPVTSNRKVATIESVAGHGEALVSGRATPDVHRVRDGAVVDRAPSGDEPVLDDAQLVALADLGRRIEAHAGGPQDVEWCLDGDGIAVVQSRPITTLFPVPEADDDAPRVYVSVGHQQMMTDPMKPLGLSMWRLTSRAPMREAGGRLFVEVTRQLASPAAREALITGTFSRADPLVGDALRTVVDRGFVPTIPDEAGAPPPVAPAGEPLDADPAVVDALVDRIEAAHVASAARVLAASGPAVFDAVVEDVADLQATVFHPDVMRVLMAGMEAVWWLNDNLEAWLGVKGGADELIRAVPGDVTAEMASALLDVADALRPHPEVVAHLRNAPTSSALDGLDGLDGGRDVRAALDEWLDRFGARGVGEIDITRPRWRERPDALVPLLLGHLEHFGPGESSRRAEEGLAAARRRRRDVLDRLRAGPDGERRATETERAIHRARTFIGFREYPKFAMIRRYSTYKEALLAEARRLVQAGVLAAEEDCFLLTFQEFGEVARTGVVDEALLRRRREDLDRYATLTPPRVLTSEGETLGGAYRRDDVPAGALVGVGVSAGTVEGRARVVRDIAAADLAPGDILVTPFTDPSWTPVFVTVAGLVTEVGGLMTHGAVVAREYGLPAVVGVEGATERILDGARIRIHGADGYVELLD